MSNIAINVDNISKCYRIGEIASYKTLRDILGGFIINKLKSHKEVNGNGKHIWALKDISFNVKQGESVGIIGKNGSGKSTLLKVISRITNPTAGMVEVYGKISALLEVGVGFNPELTGKENIKLNGTILGLNGKQIREKYDSIVEFADIGKFLNTPIKHYSSGMQVRLAFAIAIHVEPDILLVDEVLAVGDVEFQKKCLDRLAEIVRKGQTVLFVSHNLSAIKTLCSRVIALDKGRIIDDGNAVEVVNRYSNVAVKNENTIIKSQN